MCVFSEMLSYDHFLDMADFWKINSDSARIQGHYNCKCWIGLASCIRNSSHQRHAYKLNGISGPQSWPKQIHATYVSHEPFEFVNMEWWHHLKVIMLGFQIASNKFDKHIQSYTYIIYMYTHILRPAGRWLFLKITEDPTREDETELPPSVGPPGCDLFSCLKVCWGCFEHGFNISHLYVYVCIHIWGFPKMVVPNNHGFSS